MIGAHGIAGELRLKLFTQELNRYTVLDAGGRRLTLESVRASPTGAIARFLGIADRDAAEGLRGTLLTVPRSALPPLDEGEYYHADLIGLPCLSDDGVMLGRVVSVENFGAGDVIEIERVEGGRFMVPMRDEAVPDWDANRLIIAAGWTD